MIVAGTVDELPCKTRWNGSMAEGMGCLRRAPRHYAAYRNCNIATTITRVPRPHHSIVTIAPCQHHCSLLTDDITVRYWVGQTSASLPPIDPPIDRSKVWADRPHGIREIAIPHHSRIEGGLLSYGQDMDIENNPYEVGLGWQVPTF